MKTMICDENSSEMDSEVEADLYSKIYHEWSPGKTPTNTRLISKDLSKVFDELSPWKNPTDSWLSSDDRSMVHHEQRSLEEAPADDATDLSFMEKLSRQRSTILNPVIDRLPLLLDDITSSELVIEVSSDECEIISKYNYKSKSPGKRRLRRRKRLAEEVDVVLSDDDEGSNFNDSNLYIHLDCDKPAIETIDVQSDAEGEKTSGTMRSGEVVQIAEEPVTLARVSSSNGNEACTSQQLSVREIVKKRIDDFYNIHTAHHLSDRTTDEIIASLGGGPEDWFVASVDRLRSKSRTLVKSKLFCHNCRERDHRTKFCPKEKKPVCCHICGENHHVHKCPVQNCSICWIPGHRANKCPDKERIFNLICTLCNCQGHSATYCSDLWRKQHLTTKVGPTIISETSLKSTARAYCPNCGNKGHFVHQCNQALMDPNSFVHRPDIMSYSGLLATPEAGRHQPDSLVSSQQQYTKTLPPPPPTSFVNYSALSSKQRVKKRKNGWQPHPNKKRRKYGEKISQIVSSPLRKEQQATTLTPPVPLHLQNYFIKPKVQCKHNRDFKRKKLQNNSNNRFYANKVNV